MSLALAIVVAMGIVGQAGLIVWLRRQAARRHGQLAGQRARLVEAAADQQAVAGNSQTAKLDGKGVPSE